LANAGSAIPTPISFSSYRTSIPNSGFLWSSATWYWHCYIISRMSTFDKKMPQMEALVPEQDTEKLLLERLANSQSESDYFRWLLFVAGFYRGIQKVDAATALLRRFIETSNNDEQGHFQTALGLNPKQKRVVYVLHNNIAYCLNMLHRYTEGEAHCLIAIEINWTRASGYRNLGVSLKGQDKIVEAVWALVEATKLDVSDERARLLLRTLIAENPKLAVQCPWAFEGLASNTVSENSPRN
jgi:tetratricopeptide (TPR) repeat protein